MNLRDLVQTSDEVAQKPERALALLQRKGALNRIYRH